MTFDGLRTLARAPLLQEGMDEGREGGEWGRVGWRVGWGGEGGLVAAGDLAVCGGKRLAG